MPKVDVPFTNDSVSTSDPSGSVLTLVSLIVGIGIFTMALAFGQRVGNKLTNVTDSVLGTNASGDNDSPLLGSVE